MSSWFEYIAAHYLSYPIAGIAIWRLALSFILLVAALVAKTVVYRLIGIYLRRLIARTRFHLDDILISVLATPASWAVAVWGIYIAILPLGIMEEHGVTVRRVFSALVALLVMIIFLRFIDGFSEYIKPKFHKTDTTLDDAVVPALRTASKLLVILVTGIWVLNNFGYPVASILAGLGIGGLAVALAAQGTLTNWFGALMIFSDRPFTAGDRVQIGAYDGTVEQVGLRSTQLRTLDGTLVSIPNSTVANAGINNISRMPARKSNYTIGVTYDTPAEKVEEALAIIKDTLANHTQVREDFIVRFEAFADFSLNIRVIYWVLTVDYATWSTVVEQVNLEILRRFNAAEIEFAFPTQTIYMKQA